MAVITPLDNADAAALLASYDLTLIDFAPTASGIENTNYFVTATAPDAVRPRRLVLTIIEDGRTPTRFLPDLLDALTHAGLPVPALVRTTLGYAYASYPARADSTTPDGKPVLLCQHLAGVHRQFPDARDCAAIGRFLARMHRATTTLLAVAPDHPRQSTWLGLRQAELHDMVAPWQAALIDEGVDCAIDLLHRADYTALPDAVVHGDLFRDNALFTSNGLSGVIDFHHSARHKRLFDVATAINDWCTTLDNQLDDARTLALLSGYQSITPLTLMERLLLPGVLTYSALTFVLSRLHVDAAQGAADSARDRKLPNKSALPMLLKLHQHLRAPWLGRAA